MEKLKNKELAANNDEEVKSEVKKSEEDKSADRIDDEKETKNSKRQKQQSKKGEVQANAKESKEGKAEAHKAKEHFDHTKVHSGHDGKEEKKEEDARKEKVKVKTHETVGKELFSHLEPYREKHVEEVVLEFEKHNIVPDII
eukprot:TRINITY_DN2177_c0_g1_i2.p4 TRINITY_DN2177_c0_g1~~TRINITY_DN2177_c0_g1_i2.p4  ORF type:complete len:142 (-),score=58.78 TRINITY_DN2177_c0_g1_i2:1156-1581(-)